MQYSPATQKANRPNAVLKQQQITKHARSMLPVMSGGIRLGGSVVACDRVCSAPTAVMSDIAGVTNIFSFEVLIKS